MDDQLAILESKVLETIEIIQGLRRENGELSARCAGLEESLAELEGRLQEAAEERERLQRDLDEARESAAQVDQFEEKRRLVEEMSAGCSANSRP